MVQMMKVLIALISLLMLTPAFAGKKTVKNSTKGRVPSHYSCTDTQCEQMNLLFTNLSRTKQDYQKKIESSGGQRPERITSEERVWNAQQSEVYQFVCAFNFDSANAEVRETYFRFAKNVHQLMDDSIFRLEAAQCFYQTVNSHQTESAEIMKSLGGKKSFKALLAQGKPSMDF